MKNHISYLCTAPINTSSNSYSCYPSLVHSQGKEGLSLSPGDAQAACWLHNIFSGGIKKQSPHLTAKYRSKLDRRASKPNQSQKGKDSGSGRTSPIQSGHLALHTEPSCGSSPAEQHYQFTSGKEETGNLDLFLLLRQATACTPQEISSVICWRDSVPKPHKSPYGLLCWTGLQKNPVAPFQYPPEIIPKV